MRVAGGRRDVGDAAFCVDATNHAVAWIGVGYLEEVRTGLVGAIVCGDIVIAGSDLGGLHAVVIVFIELMPSGAPGKHYKTVGAEE